VTLLEVVDATVRFGAVRAVEGVNMEVDAGAFVGVIGPNGAGKTTLFNAITGFARLASGSISLNGRTIHRLPPTARARHGIVRTFQNVGLNKSATVHENLLTAQSAGTLWRELTGRRSGTPLMAMAEMTGVAHVLGSRVADLSIGVAKNVELACALARRPRLLLLDEPSSGLSPEETNRLGDVLLDVWREADLTILMIEHDMELVGQVVQRVYALNFGALMASGSPAEVAREPAVVDAYLGEPVPEGRSSQVVT